MILFLAAYPFAKVSQDFDFVQETLLHIVRGVASLQKPSSEKCLVNVGILIVWQSPSRYLSRGKVEVEVCIIIQSCVIIIWNEPSKN